MIYLILGTDRARAKQAMQARITKIAGEASVVRVTDVSSRDDMVVALQGGGMFGGQRVLVFEGVCTNAELSGVFLDALERLAASTEEVLVYEEKPLADLKRMLEKNATSVERFDLPKKERDTGIFVIANALKAGDKRALWVSYMREIAKGSAPEAVHGILFWGAKDMFLKASGNAAARTRAAALVATLAELPHDARRRGEDLEYALERFVLSGA